MQTISESTVANKWILVAYREGTFVLDQIVVAEGLARGPDGGVAAAGEREGAVLLAAMVVRHRAVGVDAGVGAALETLVWGQGGDAGRAAGGLLGWGGESAGG